MPTVAEGRGITLHSNSPSGWPHLEQKLSEFFHWRRDQPRVRQLAIPSSTVKRPNRRSVNRPPYSASISRGSTWPPTHAFSHQIKHAPVRIVGTAGRPNLLGKVGPVSQATVHSHCFHYQFTDRKPTKSRGNETVPVPTCQICLPFEKPSDPLEFIFIVSKNRTK